MTIDSRHLRVLAAVVEEYVRTAQPVGSKALSKSGLKASSATIRNLMSDLESMGLLEKPHTSAGRLPTHQGLRHYVDHLIDQIELDAGERGRLEAVGESYALDPEHLISQTALVLSELSRQVGVVMAVPVEHLPLKSVHLNLAGSRRIVVHFGFHDGSGEERLIDNEWDLDASSLLRLQNLLNRLASGRTLISLRRELIRQLEDARKTADRVLARAVELSGRLLEMEEPLLIVRGQANLLDQVDLKALDRIKDALRSLEEKALVIEVLEQARFSVGTRVFIGEEMPADTMRGCAIVTTSYGRGDLPAGALGVIGPTRMDYARIIPMVEYTSALISRALENFPGAALR